MVMKSMHSDIQESIPVSSFVPFQLCHLSGELAFWIISHWASSSLRKVLLGLEKWIRGLGHLLLLERTQAPFPEPTTCNSSSREFKTLPQIPQTHVHTLHTDRYAHD